MEVCVEDLRQQFEALRGREDAAFEDGRDSVEALYESAMALVEKCLGTIKAEQVPAAILAEGQVTGVDLPLGGHPGAVRIHFGDATLFLRVRDPVPLLGQPVRILLG